MTKQQIRFFYLKTLAFSVSISGVLSFFLFFVLNLFETEADTTEADIFFFLIQQLILFAFLSGVFRIKNNEKILVEIFYFFILPTIPIVLFSIINYLDYYMLGEVTRPSVMTNIGSTVFFLSIVYNYVKINKTYKLPITDNERVLDQPIDNNTSVKN